MDLVFTWVRGFARFWYHFLIGDDWLLAAAVVAGLVTTGLLQARGLRVFWLVPLLVVAVVGVSLRRARRA